VGVVALTDAATITPDCAKGVAFRVTIAGNRTIATPSNLQDGMSIALRITQDATGSRVPTFGSKWKLPSASGTVFSTAAGKVDLVTGAYFSDIDQILCGALIRIA
jgi:hypothetical protein